MVDYKSWYLTKNDCFKANQKMTPRGIVVHSTGCNNPTLRRYIQPNDGIIGVNANNNHWNRPNLDTCVHAFIGKTMDGTVACYQTLPFDVCAWGVGKGKKGSYNYSPAYIQFEMCEDGLKDAVYFNEVMDLAQSLCAYLIQRYNIPLESVVSHKEAHALGYASNHGDCENWLSKFGRDMNWFRRCVKEKIGEKTPVEIETTTSTPVLYTVKKGDTLASIASMYHTTYQQIAKDNGIANPNIISKGQVLKIYSAETEDALQIGDKISLDANATYYNGKTIPNWVKKSTLYFRGDNSNGAIISTLKIGAITGTVNRKFIHKL